MDGTFGGNMEVETWGSTLGGIVVLKRPALMFDLP